MAVIEGTTEADVPGYVGTSREVWVWNDEVLVELAKAAADEFEVVLVDELDDDGATMLDDLRLVDVGLLSTLEVPLLGETAVAVADDEFLEEVGTALGLILSALMISAACLLSIMLMRDGQEVEEASALTFSATP